MDRLLGAGAEVGAGPGRTVAIVAGAGGAGASHPRCRAGSVSLPGAARCPDAARRRRPAGRRTGPAARARSPQPGCAGRRWRAPGGRSGADELRAVLPRSCRRDGAVLGPGRPGRPARRGGGVGAGGRTPRSRPGRASTCRGPAVPRSTRRCPPPTRCCSWSRPTYGPRRPRPRSPAGCPAAWPTSASWSARPRRPGCPPGRWPRRWGCRWRAGSASEPGLAAALQRGEPPGRARGPLAQLCQTLLPDLVRHRDGLGGAA